jgi:LuxR family maltose regulon positive regulatory protein
MSTENKKTEPFVLLRTKFQRHRLRTSLVPRPRLLEQLNAGLRQGDLPGSVGFTRKLILISAPAGYGNTTALGQWLDDCAYPSAWLSLDAGDSDLSVFLTYLVGAVRTVYPDACPQTSSLLQSHQVPPPEYLAGTLTNGLADLPDKLVLALDDFHRIEGTAVPKLVTALLDHLPSQVCLAIATRQDPGLPLVRLRASGEMVELRMADLCFALDEVQAFLEQAVGTALSAEFVQALEERTEGWIVGLRLAALSLRGAQDPTAFVQSFQASGHRYVMGYLVDEVLSQQSPATQGFLLRTSILERFCASLCDAVCFGCAETLGSSSGTAVTVGMAGTPARSSRSAAILEELDHANLFLVPLDFEGKWYRYHHLFQELLAHRLQAQTSGQEIACLHSRASAWFANNELVEEALVHALAAGDVTGAARLVEDRYRQAVNRGQWARLGRWLARLPDSTVEQRPGLLVALCWCLHREFEVAATAPVIMGATAILEDPESSAELNLQEGERRYLLAELDGLRSQVLYWLAAFEDGLDYAEKSLAHLSATFSYGRSGAWFYWVLHSHALGRSKEATSKLQRLIRAEPESSPFNMHLYLGLCYVYRSSADFARLSQVGHAYLSAAQKAELPESVAFAHYHLGVLHYEWNELETARRHFEAAINLRYHAHEVSYCFSLQGLALVHLAQDRPEKVQDTIAAVREFAQQTESNLLLASIRSFQAWLLVLRGDLGRADRESRAAYDGSQVEPMLLFEIPALTRAKVLVARATPESLRQAMVLLDELLARAEKTHMAWRQIEILALQALALAAQGQTDEALSRLEQAVTLARPGWLVRTFVDLGSPLAELLRQLTGRGVATAYLNQVLAAFPLPSKAQPPILAAESELVEPLTERELEVLVLIGERLTNQEIAQRLVISPETVKRHASNIYQKLSVHNRRQAAAKARNLGILSPA